MGATQQLLAANVAAASINWTLKAHSSGTSPDAINVATSGVDTTGANLIVIALSRLAGQSLTITDSKSNTWTALTTRNDGTGSLTLYYCVNPTVGTGHTFAGTGSGNNFATLFAAAFSSGTTLSSPVDQQSGGTTTGTTTVQPGSITPAHASELLICALEFFGGGLPSISSGFTITDRIDSSGGVNFGGGLAYLIQTSAAAVNPTWTNSGFSNAATGIVSFAG